MSNEVKKTSTSESPCFSCGLITGVLVTGFFSPYDRALFISVRDRRPFLSRLNFVAPYQAFSQSVGVRAISSGLWFPLEHFFRNIFSEKFNFLAGACAGIISSVTLNPLQAIKYQTWGHDGPGVFAAEARRMWLRGGLTPFLFGIRARLFRDVSFGAVYSSQRQKKNKLLSKKYIFAVNSAAAVLATVVSSPFNYIQNVQYSTSSKYRQPSDFKVFQQLVSETCEKSSMPKKMRFLQQRLRIGWGTARVAFGMALANFLYDNFYDFHYNTSI